MPNWNGCTEYAKQVIEARELAEKLAARSPLHLELARMELLGQFWRPELVMEIVGRHLAQLDEADTAAYQAATDDVTRLADERRPETAAALAIQDAAANDLWERMTQ